MEEEGSKEKWAFLNKLCAEGQVARAQALLSRGSAVFPAGHNAGSSWSAEGGLPRQTGKCSGSPSCGSAPPWKQPLSRDGIEPGLVARQPVGCWAWGAPACSWERSSSRFVQMPAGGAALSQVFTTLPRVSLYWHLPRGKWISSQDYSGDRKPVCLYLGQTSAKST